MRALLARTAEAHDRRTADLRVGAAAGGRSGDRAEASARLGTLLTRPRCKSVQAAAFLSRVASLQLMAAARIAVVESRLQRIRMSTRRVKALGVALTEIMHFVDTGVPDDGSVNLYLVLAREECRLVMALAVEGDYRLVASAAGTRSLMRAMAITRELGGDFGRGVIEEGMVFGVVVKLPRKAGWRDQDFDF